MFDLKKLSLNLIVYLLINIYEKNYVCMCGQNRKHLVQIIICKYLVCIRTIPKNNFSKKILFHKINFEY